MDRMTMTTDAPGGAAPAARSARRKRQDDATGGAAGPVLPRLFWLGPMGRMSAGWNRLTALLLLAVVLVVLVTFSDYGVTWDEDVHNWYGVFVLDYYLSLFKDARLPQLAEPLQLRGSVSTRSRRCSTASRRSAPMRRATC